MNEQSMLSQLKLYSPNLTKALYIPLKSFLAQYRAKTVFNLTLLCFSSSVASFNNPFYELHFNVKKHFLGHEWA